MTRPLTVLSVAYTLAPVGPDAVGGAEQVLAMLDHALVRAGHRSIVVACRGSVAAGTLIDTGVDPGRNVDAAARQHAQAATRTAMQQVLQRTQVDVLHLHGLDFAETLPLAHPPALVTLHLPPGWYGTLADRPGVFLHCVSESQAASCPPGMRLLPPIPNGVDVDRLTAARHARRGFALMLGRVCAEKGQHIGLRAAHLAGVPLLIGGAVFPYPEHQAFFASEVAPLLDHARRFLGPVGLARKRRLLAAARCLLVPSLAPETSSLVAMEALACGTPVVAYAAGALAGIVEHGRTGFLVQSAAEMAQAIGAAGSIEPEACRQAARDRFSQAGMIAAYLERYRQLAGQAAYAA